MKAAKTDGRQFSRLLRGGKELTRALLQAASDGCLLFEGAQRYRQVAVYEGPEGLRRIISEKQQRAVKRRIRDLKRSGLIEEERAAGRIMFACTEKGQDSLFRRTLRRAGLRSDGRSVLVIFDIPERRRGARAVLRTLLRSCGCQRLQQSVWVTKFDITRQLSGWLRRERLKAWVRIFLIDSARPSD